MVYINGVEYKHSVPSITKEEVDNLVEPYLTSWRGRDITLTPPAPVLSQKDNIQLQKIFGEADYSSWRIDEEAIRTLVQSIHHKQVPLSSFIRDAVWQGYKFTRLGYLLEPLDKMEKLETIQDLFNNKPQNSNGSISNRELLSFMGYSLPVVANYFAFNYITKQGISVVVNYLQDKGSLPKQNINIYDCWEDFTDDFKRIVDDSTITEQYSLINADRNHISSVYMFKQEGRWIVIQTDAACENYNEEFVRAVESAVKEIPGFDLNYICFSQVPRQADTNSCAVFAIRDLAMIHQNKESFLALVRSETSSQTGIIRTLNQLPLEMMKGTQSLTVIKVIAAERLKSGQSIIIRSKKSDSGEETIFENVGRHIKDVEDREQNHLIQDRYDKYLGLIVKTFFGNQKRKATE